MRVVFMGSPEVAVPSLEMLQSRHRVVGVVTQPDRPAGRGSRLRPPPVKVVAREYGLPVVQPEDLRTAEAVERLGAWGPEVIVVVAFGQILPPSVLKLPPHGCLNVHASLLPRWRGAAPVPAAILAGDDTTGVTVMRMDEGLDTGPILAQLEEPIRADDTAGSLLGRLGVLGAELLLQVLPLYEKGHLVPRPQPAEGVTVAPQLRKQDGQLDWTRQAVELDRQVRAMNPWPGAFTTWRGQRLNVLRALPLPDWQGTECPGTVLPMGAGAAVATGRGALQLLEVQRTGRKAMAAEAFLCGQQDCVGSLLGQD